MAASNLPRHWDPFREMDDVRTQFARLMGWPMEASPADTGPVGRFAAADLVDLEDSLVVQMDLPGIDRKDIEIALSDDLLTIRGERKVSTERKDENTGQVRFAERGFGRFERSFRLPVDVDPERVNATFNSGVLEVRLHKAPTKRLRRIEVTGG